MFHQFSSIQLLHRIQLFVTPWIAPRLASLSITNSRSLLKLMSIESVMPSSHLILCRPLLLLPPVPPSIGVFSNESTLRMRWPKYWSFSFSISPSNEHPRYMYKYREYMHFSIYTFYVVVNAYICFLFCLLNRDCSSLTSKWSLGPTKS